MVCRSERSSSEHPGRWSARAVRFRNPAGTFRSHKERLVSVRLRSQSCHSISIRKAAATATVAATALIVPTPKTGHGSSCTPGFTTRASQPSCWSISRAIRRPSVPTSASSCSPRKPSSPRAGKDRQERIGHFVRTALDKIFIGPFRFVKSVFTGSRNIAVAMLPPVPASEAPGRSSAARSRVRVRKQEPATKRVEELGEKAEVRESEAANSRTGATGAKAMPGQG